MNKNLYRNIKNLLGICPEVVAGSYEPNTACSHLHILVSSFICVYLCGNDCVEMPGNYKEAHERKEKECLGKRSRVDNNMCDVKVKGGYWSGRV